MPESACNSRKILLSVLCILILALLANSVFAKDDAVTYYTNNCTACHTIGGGKLVGPDLKNVTDRRDREWLVNFIMNPQAVIDSGDEYALKLKQEANGLVMQIMPGMTPELASALIDYIEVESSETKSEPGVHEPENGNEPVEEPFTQNDILRGRDYFTGKKPLENGGPACIGCHSSSDLGGLGGGRLGPDLTKVYERLGGRRALTAWLTSPATPTMRSAFRNNALDENEIKSLVAYFESTNQFAETAGAGSSRFLLLGLGGSILLLLAFGAIWKSRFTSVRSNIVKSASIGGQK